MGFNCPKCGKKFSDKSEFRKHGKEQHTMSEIEINEILEGWRYFR